MGLTPATGVLIRRVQDADTHRGAAARGPGEETATYKPEKEARENQTRSTSILDFWPPEPGENKLTSLPPPGLCYFVMKA